MFEILPQGGSFGIAPVTSLHVAPASRVRCTSPSFEPAHKTPACTGDSAIANRVAPSKVIKLSVVTPPELCWWAAPLRVRSGLIPSHLEPPPALPSPTCPPTQPPFWP